MAQRCAGQRTFRPASAQAARSPRPGTRTAPARRDRPSSPGPPCAKEVFVDVLDRLELAVRPLLGRRPAGGRRRTVEVVDVPEVAHPAIDAEQIERRRRDEVDRRPVGPEEAANFRHTAQHGAASSMGSAAASTAPSAPRRPMICRDTGRPSSPRPMGIAQAGRPARLASNRNAPSPRRTPARSSEPSKASQPTVGVNKRPERVEESRTRGGCARGATCARKVDIGRDGVAGGQERAGGGAHARAAARTARPPTTAPRRSRSSPRSRAEGGDVGRVPG